MLYTVLIYGDDGLYDRLSEAEQEAVLVQHRALQSSLKEKGTYRGSVRLMPPSTAMSVKENASKPMVLDGPFAETKEQILGLYLLEAESMEEALEAAKALPIGVASMEVRPVMWGEVVEGS